MKSAARESAKYVFGAGMIGSLLLAQGCIATRDWVKEQMDPVTGRVTQSEGRLDKTEKDIGGLGTRVTGVEGKLGQLDSRVGQLDSRLGQVDGKADKALSAIANLRLERKLVIDMKEGANFAFNSSNLPAQAQSEIDSFLSDLKSDVSGTDGVVIMVAGHTDNAGSENFNYELGKRRAEAVSRYLITKKSMDPLRVVPVSYGETTPAADNSSPQGRAKNRRVEILIYRDGVTSTAAAPAPQQQQQPAPRSSQSEQPAADRLSQK